MSANDLNSLADAPGTSREYETIYILRPNTTNEGVAEVNTRVRGVIENMGGKIIKVDNWGKRRLAYEIAKERKGIYLYWQYLATRGIVEEVERNFRMLDSVIRYLSVKIDTDVDPGARPTEIDEEAYERAANTAADEEDLYLIRGGEEGEGTGEDGDDLDEFGDDGDFEGDEFYEDEAFGDAAEAVPGDKEPAAESEEE